MLVIQHDCTDGWIGFFQRQTGLRVELAVALLLFGIPVIEGGAEVKAKDTQDLPQDHVAELQPPE